MDTRAYELLAKKGPAGTAPRGANHRARNADGTFRGGPRGALLLVPERRSGWEPAVIATANAEAPASCRASTAASELDLRGGQDGAALAPTQVRLLPSGEIETRPHDGREPWHNTHPQAVVDASRAMATDLPLDLPIDYEHQGERSRSNGLPASAEG